MIGKIIKGISGFYYVDVKGFGIYECKAKGIFRKEGIKPLVGDDAEIEVLSEEEKTGNICRLLPRKNDLIRPSVANIDQALIIFSAWDPRPNFNLLDRFLVMMEYQDIPVIICFNKVDLCSLDYLDSINKIYEHAGYQIIYSSAKEGIGHDELVSILEGKTTTVAGPSGAGKSSIINTLQSIVSMETGEISKKLGRGRHTTRHAELIKLDINEPSFIVDTPGFSTMDIPGFEKEDVRDCYPEFVEHEPNCKFAGCSHINEPHCGVKEALNNGLISSVRYENYLKIYEELDMKRKY